MAALVRCGMSLRGPVNPEDGTTLVAHPRDGLGMRGLGAREPGAVK